MKNRIKKTVSLLLVVIMLLTSAPLAGVTDLDLFGMTEFFSISSKAIEEGSLTYKVENGEATITDCDKYIGGELVIPDTLGGYPVTSIDDFAFSNCRGLTSITLPDSLTSIGDYAFNECTGLTSVTLPNSLTSIGEYAFSGCTGLTSITIPDSVTNIGRCAFDGTAWYAAQPFGDVYAGKVYYKYKGTMLENTSIEIKEGTKGIAGNAFCGCDGLLDISIPQSVTNIGEYAFSGCDILTEVIVPESVKTIGDGAFSRCDSLKEIMIPESVKTIGDYAFNECIRLSHIEIPDSVISIGDGAFEYSAISHIIIPDSVTYLGKSAFAGCGSLTSATIGSGIETIFGMYPDIAGTFEYCPNLTTIKIKKGVKTIEEYAFRGIKSIPDIYFEGSEEEWKEISIDQSNDMILRANMHYNADLSHEHSYTETVEEATCTETGLKTFTCSCGKTYTETIPAIGHNYQPVVVNPTCVSIGYETSTCQNCGVSYFIRAIPALGHTDTDNDGNCDRCGEKTGEPVDPPKPDDPSATCTHICHKGGISAFFYKIARFFWKLFKTNKYCSCGAAHY